MSARYLDHRIALACICVLSFLLFAVAALALGQYAQDGWRIESTGPIPVALSHLYYGSPLGTVDYNLLMKSYPETTTVREVIDAGVSGSVPRGQLLMYSLDGNGVGANLFATIAFRMFGSNVLSLLLFYLLFVGITVIAFVLRFHDRRLLVLPLYFFVTLLLLATPISSSHIGVDQTPVGGVRYFTMAAFIPGLHILLELLDRITPRRPQFVFLAFVQAFMLAGALLARSSASYLLGAFFLAIAWRFYRDRRLALVALTTNSLAIGSAFVAWMLIIMVCMPAYVQDGRVFSVFWHRAFVSLSDHPDWPFGDLKTIYSCKPAELTRSNADMNGGCVWLAYPPNAKRSERQITIGIYSGEYERAVRSAFFYVVAHYPKKVLGLFVYYKSKLILETLKQAFGFLGNLGDAPNALVLLPLAAIELALFLIVIAMTASGSSLILAWEIAIIFPLLFLLAIAPRYVAWASWMTGVDLIFLMYSCLVLLPFTVVQLAPVAFRWYAGKQEAHVAVPLSTTLLH